MQMNKRSRPYWEDLVDFADAGSRKSEFNQAFDSNKRKDGTCVATVLSEYLGIAERTIRDRVKEFNDEYVTKKGIISRK